MTDKTKHQLAAAVKWAIDNAEIIKEFPRDDVVKYANKTIGVCTQALNAYEAEQIKGDAATCEDAGRNLPFTTSPTTTDTASAPKIEDDVREAVDIACEAMAHAHGVFVYYAQNHRQKATPDGDYKAERNMQEAGRLQDALIKIRAATKGEK